MWHGQVHFLQAHFSINEDVRRIRRASVTPGAQPQRSPAEWRALSVTATPQGLRRRHCVLPPVKPENIFVRRLSIIYGTDAGMIVTQDLIPPHLILMRRVNRGRVGFKPAFSARASFVYLLGRESYLYCFAYLFLVLSHKRNNTFWRKAGKNP